MEVVSVDPTALFNVLSDAIDKKSSFQWTLASSHKFFLNSRVNHLLELAQAQEKAFHEKFLQDNLAKEPACESGSHDAVDSSKQTAACALLPHETDCSVHTDTDGASYSSCTSSAATAAENANSSSAAVDQWAIYRPEDCQSMTFSSYVAGGCEICLMVSTLVVHFVSYSFSCDPDYSDCDGLFYVQLPQQQEKFARVYP
jgi:hypothetical protein